MASADKPTAELALPHFCIQIEKRVWSIEFWLMPTAHHVRSLSLPAGRGKARPVLLEME
jgi:hypothetical protein